jgi:molecular chaperone IbpA
MGNLIEYKWFFDRVGYEQKNSFPLFNIYALDDMYRDIVIDIALVGFNKDEISVSCDSDRLKIVGKKSEEINKNVKYIARNIATRGFTKEFVITKYHVTDCKFDNGMLSISLQIDDAKDTKTIEIK